uniref:Ribosomal protein L6 n=1 Tax=Cavenderia fasciculata TaxID=261658 RepID=B2XXA2_CACFS|nr:ribosomal protein L6 [Cavenderia fasciculata]ABX45224.1 ribosomal protein L6 [Cavenderia fasciculata]
MKYNINKKINNFELQYFVKKGKKIEIINRNDKGMMKILLKLRKKVYVQKNKLYFKKHSDSRNYISKIKYTIKSLMSGYFAEIKLVGLGFLVYKVKKTIVFDLGYSHFICYTIPTTAVLKVVDKNVVAFGQVSDTLFDKISIIKQLRRVNKYTGTGILNIDQKIKLKEGKLR